MRVGEIEALEWKDIDFENRLIHVSKSYSHGVLSSTKNKRVRKVDMSLQLAETLKELRLTQKKIALKTGKQVSNRVFTTGRGAFLDRNQLRKALLTCLQQAGIRKIRIHDLRHSYATIRLVRGHSIGDVSYQLGHSSISITFDVYGHWIPGKFKSEVDGLDKLETQQNATYPQLDEQ